MVELCCFGWWFVVVMALWMKVAAKLIDDWWLMSGD